MFCINWSKRAEQLLHFSISVNSSLHFTSLTSFQFATDVYIYVCVRVVYLLLGLHDLRLVPHISSCLCCNQLYWQLPVYVYLKELALTIQLGRRNATKLTKQQEFYYGCCCQSNSFKTADFEFSMPRPHQTVGDLVSQSVCLCVIDQTMIVVDGFP